MTDLKTLLKQGEGIAVEYKVCQRALSRDVGCKNPVIAHFFQQIGRADELGSGTRKLMKYGKLFGGSDPELIEGDVFRIVVKYPDFDAPQAGQTAVTAQVTGQEKPAGAQSGAQSGGESGGQWRDIVQTLVEQSLSANELTAKLKLESKTGSFKRTIKDLLGREIIEYTIPDNPKSRLQKYRLTAKGKDLLESTKKSQD